MKQLYESVLEVINEGQQRSDSRGINGKSMREETSFEDRLIESGLFSDEEVAQLIEAINEK